MEFKLVLHSSQYFFLAVEIYTTVLERLYRTIDYKVFQLITNFPFMAVGITVIISVPKSAVK